MFLYAGVFRITPGSVENEAKAMPYLQGMQILLVELNKSLQLQKIHASCLYVLVRPHPLRIGYL
jgi:hypothetical protein